ncbi:MAG TPA: NAD-dependent dehydratase [Candidatus Riflebacteria bacterium]|nr:NAD-dependent dehydratase [Candidatus Riflebacteria bacterium]
MNYLVTGADGFIGSNLTRKLVEQHYTVTALLQSQSQGSCCKTLTVDLVQDEKIDLAGVAPVDAIIHLAGKAHAVSEIGEGDEYFALNTEGTRKLLEATRKIGVQRFVYFSSVKAMGEGSWQTEDENTPCQPSGAYGQSKLDAEKLVLEGGYVPEPVVIRPTMVYGQTDKGNLPRMIRMARKGLFPPLADNGNRRSMVHVEDIVQAAILAAARPEAIGQVYIVSDGQAYSTRKVYELILKALGRCVPPFDCPTALLSLAARIGDVFGRLRGRRFIFDTDTFEKLFGSAYYSSAKIERELGFRPQRTLENSIAELIDYLK